MKTVGLILLSVGSLMLIEQVLPVVQNMISNGLPLGVRITWRAIEVDFQLQDYEGRIVEVFLWPVYIAMLLLAVSLGILVASPTSRNHSLPNTKLAEDPIENVISVDQPQHLT